VAYWFTFGLAWLVLNRRLGHLQARQTAWVLGRLLIAGAVAGFVGFGVNLAFTAFVGNLRDEVVPLGFVGMPGWALMATALTCTAAVLVYVVMARLLRVQEISQAWSLVSEKLPIGRRG
jgi:peptidoglycan biosynthesis protein MviN/MurJ (putative lipid II flippase)